MIRDETSKEKSKYTYIVILKLYFLIEVSIPQTAIWEDFSDSLGKLFARINGFTRLVYTFGLTERR